MGLPVRKGVFVGFWCPPEVKRSLQAIATSEHRSLSQELNRLVEAFVKARQSQTEEKREEVKQ